LTLALLALPALAGAEQRPYIDESHPDYYARRYWRNYRSYWGFKYQHSWQDPALREKRYSDQIDDDAITERLLRGEDAREVFKDVPGTRKLGGIRAGRGPVWRRVGEQEAPEIPKAGEAKVGAIKVKNETGAPIRFKLNGVERTLASGEEGVLASGPKAELLVTLNRRTRLFALDPKGAYSFVEKDGIASLVAQGGNPNANTSGFQSPQYKDHEYGEEFKDSAIIKVASPRGAFVSVEFENGTSKRVGQRGVGAFYPIAIRVPEGQESVTAAIRVEAEVRGGMRTKTTPMLTIKRGQKVELEVKPNAGGNRLRVLWW
jgi:hypothetical protein